MRPAGPSTFTAACPGTVKGSTYTSLLAWCAVATCDSPRLKRHAERCLDCSLSHHSLCHLQEASNVGARCQVHLVLFSSLHACLDDALQTHSTHIAQALRGTRVLLVQLWTPWAHGQWGPQVFTSTNSATAGPLTISCTCTTTPFFLRPFRNRRLATAATWSAVDAPPHVPEIITAPAHVRHQDCQ